MGEYTINPTNSDKSKELIDNEIKTIIRSASDSCRYILKQSHDLIEELVEPLIEEKSLKRDKIEAKIYRKYPNLLKLDV
jgi:ATP-dependent Zn protease